MTEKIRTLQVPLGDRSYRIHIGENLFSPGGKGLEKLGKQLSGRKVLIVADSNTERLFSGTLCRAAAEAGAQKVSVCIFPAGEKSKRFSEVEKICRAAAENGLDRSSLILALGGGVTGDMAGFAASIFMRGIDFVQIPTTLLAMVDSSVGGKTGADLPEGKNLIGTFHQPKMVLMDVSFLRSLPRSELRCGYAELIKHAVLFDPKLFRTLLENAEELLALKCPELLTSLLARSCRLKASVVARDERESSLRALLNYGHSFGHALEKAADFTRYTHGEAVAIGMCMAADLAQMLEKTSPETVSRQEALIRAFGLPTAAEGLSADCVFQAMRGDKKNIGGITRLILPRRIGKAEIAEQVPGEQILEAVRRHCD